LAKNACGTVGVFHTILNIYDKDADLIKKDSFFFYKFFLNETSKMNAKERGTYFLNSKELK